MNFYDWFFKEVGREPAGLFSFAHIFTVTLTLAIFLTLAVFLGKKFKNDPKKQNLVLLIAGIAIVTIQLSKNIYLLIETDNVLDCIIGNWPLYFCDIPIYVIPLAALTKGRFKQWCLDFMAICGLLMGFMGNYFAGNLYPVHAIISFSVFNALLNHSISAFTALFIWVAGMNKMEKRDIPYVVGILFAFMSIALVMDYTLEKNFMFFFSGDGTPFTIFYNLVGLSPDKEEFQPAIILYQMIIYILQCGYVGVFYLVYYPIVNKISIKKQETAKQ